MIISGSLQSFVPNALKIGIISDSHGDKESILSAASFLRSKNCQEIFHLGDICDSFNTKTANECVDIIKKLDIKAIKGNNDYNIALNLTNNDSKIISTENLNFLHNLPIVLEYERAIFAHSLPFEKELGLSCMIRTLGKEETSLFFNNYKDRILIRGHNHYPEIIWKNSNNNISCPPISIEQEINLARYIPYIITCGSLTRRCCIIWKPKEESLTFLNFH